MGAATCQHCGQPVDVIDPGKPWQCPSCRKIAGPPGGLALAAKAGWVVVLFAAAALFGLIAVSGFLFG